MLMVKPVASASWEEKVLYSFQGGNDGAIPAGGVVFDKAGNLYGATSQGGGSNCPPISNCGTVFQLSPPVKKGDPWTESILHVFLGVPGNDGATPAGNVAVDANGNLYGTTAYGGSGGCILLGIKGGCGTVYELSPPQTKGGAWTYTILYSFQSGKDGYFPWGDLTLDSKGNLYGATQFGGGKGTSCNPFYQYCGTVFELSPPKQKGGKWTEKVLHSFAGIPSGKQSGDGASPNGGLTFDVKGAIFGTTLFGGANEQKCKTDSGVGCGTVVELKPPRKSGGAWTELVLHRFTAGNDGAAPRGGLIFDSKGSLFGTAGGGNGLVFRFTLGRNHHWIDSVLYNFPNCQDGCGPSGLTLGSQGYLFGSAGSGPNYSGTIFRLTQPASSRGSWAYALLYSFKGSPDGYGPLGVSFRGSRTMYGTTQYGGAGQACQGGCGAVFEVAQ